jgi:hypothetical protein
MQHLSNAVDVLEGKVVPPATAPAKEGLRLLNNDVNILLEKRKTELKQGLLETETKKGLLEMKSIVDQFNFISNIVTDLQKVSGKINLQ